MHELKVTGIIETQAILKENNMMSYHRIATSIGNDGKIYCLFTESIPERIDGMFVPVTNNSNYKAISFTVDWYSGEIYKSELIDFGVLSINVHFIQPIDGNFLLLGARATQYRDGSADQNAIIIDRFGNQIQSFCLGDGIENCIVDSQNNIVTSYFDEGIFGNNGWNDPLGANGIVKWSKAGEKLWENENHAICDCYAMNIDDNDDLWFYYYTDFLLVKTNYQSEVTYNPQTKGSHGVLLSQSQTALLFQKGYGEKGFYVIKIKDNELSKPSDSKIVFANEVIDIEGFSFRGSNAVFTNAQGELYFLKWIYG